MEISGGPLTQGNQIYHRANGFSLNCRIDWPESESDSDQVNLRIITISVVKGGWSLKRIYEFRVEYISH